jgi:hypothetical protein
MEVIMYKTNEMEGTPVLATLRLRNKYKTYWRNKSDWYWMWRLFQEVCELFGSLLRIHKDPVKWELMQIAAICLNWMYKREEEFTAAANASR